MDFLSKFDIELEKEIWYPGETLNATVVVNNTENLKVRGIQVTLRGKAHVEWKIIKSGEKRTVKEDQYFMDEKITVWGKERDDEGPAPILHRGEHRFPAQFKLAETNLPCSFESKIGTIRYYLRVFIFVPHMSSPQGVKYFTVIAPHIDCMESRFLTPTTLEDGQVSCCFCCQRERQTLVVTMDRSAYCCGENIKIKGHVVNNTKQECWITCRLIQCVEYFISRGVLGITKEVHHKVRESRSRRIQPQDRMHYDEKEFDLQVPVMPPTVVDICKIIQIYYLLKVSLCSERTHHKSDEEDLELEFPVTVATMPFRIPTAPSPTINYEVAVSYAEGGMYISPEFQGGGGGIYMGDELGGETNEDAVFYRPVYPCIPHKMKPTAVSDIHVSVSEETPSNSKPKLDDTKQC